MNSAEHVVVGEQMANGVSLKQRGGLRDPDAGSSLAITSADRAIGARSRQQARRDCWPDNAPPTRRSVAPLAGIMGCTFWGTSVGWESALDGKQPPLVGHSFEYVRAPVGQGDARTDEVKFDGFGDEHFCGAGEITDAFGEC
ncbi:MAG: hypothetical protein M3067_12895 [Chloroflexota bacterium]|nr:hypothetical protein [Chloroflexota bacterium]